MHQNITNKKIIFFCVVSLVAICIFLAGRGDASGREGESTDVVKQTVSPSTGTAIITSASESAVFSSEDKEDDSLTQKEENGEDGAKKDKNGKDQTDGKTDPADEKNDADRNDSDKAGKTEKKKHSDPSAKPGKKASVKQKKTHPTKSPAASVPNPADTPVPGTADAASEPEHTASQTAEAKNECYLQITCAEVFSHMDELAQSAKKVIPDDGIILQGTYPFKKGDTVFDLLKQACAEQNVLLDYVFTPGFSTYYIKGINNLYEFDCGDESGWMYLVNGKKPDYGCSQYTLNKGDKVVFYYTCERS